MSVTRRHSAWISVVFAVSLAVVPLRPAAAETEFPSAWRTKEIVVDGLEDEWAGHLVPIPETPVSLGVQNDASFLYLCLRTSDEAMKRRIRALGVTVFFDATGGEERSYALRYPASPERPAPGAGDAPPSSASGTPRLRRQASLDEIEILGAPEGSVRRLKLAEARPVAAALGEQDGTLVLEMKIPLAAGPDTPFAVRAAPGKTISLGLEGAPPGRQDRAGQSQTGGGEGGAGFGGGFGGGGHWGRGGGGHGRAAGDRPAEGTAASLRKWFRVSLASPPP